METQQTSSADLTTPQLQSEPANAVPQQAAGVESLENVGHQAPQTALTAANPDMQQVPVHITVHPETQQVAVYNAVCPDTPQVPVPPTGVTKIDICTCHIKSSLGCKPIVSLREYMLTCKMCSGAMILMKNKENNVCHYGVACVPIECQELAEHQTAGTGREVITKALVHKNGPCQAQAEPIVTYKKNDAGHEEVTIVVVQEEPAAIGLQETDLDAGIETDGKPFQPREPVRADDPGDTEEFTCCQKCLFFTLDTGCTIM